MSASEKTTLYIIKIGGNIINDKNALKQFLAHFAAIPFAKILVHGGGRAADHLAEQLGIVPIMHEGRRITDEATLEVVTMVYAGLINTQITAGLHAFSCNALGLSGADANVILARKRPVGVIDYGYVGDVVAVNAAWIHSLLAAGITPVVAPITHDGSGQLLNTNADTIAAELAKALCSSYNVELCYCFEKSGVLIDVNDASTVVPLLDEQKFHQMKEQALIANGMLPKLTNTFATLKAGVQQVRILHAHDLPLLLAGGTQVGTLCRL